MKLKGKIIIKGQFKTLTGLHIGGSKSSLAIGGIDNSVIKTAKGRPYIPGSSIKGKLRSLLAKIEGSLFFSESDYNKELDAVDSALANYDDGKTRNLPPKKIVEQYKSIISKGQLHDEAHPYIMELFGFSGDNDQEFQIHQTRLLVRDAFLNEDAWTANFDKETEYAHGKWENVINRRTGTAEHPRQMERVPAGAIFDFELAYSVFEEGEATQEVLNQHLNKILFALQLLQDDGIGGQLSRGYGQVKVLLGDIICKEIKEYRYEVTKLSESQLISEKTKQLIEKFN